MIRKASERRTEHKLKYKEAEENMRIQKTLEERQKSSNERELDRYFQEKREKEIKEQLDHIRSKQNKENWKGDNLMNGTSILKEDRPILKEKNIFKGNQHSNLIKGEMFFKW